MLIHNQRGFVHALMLLILLIGIGVGVYLSLHPQIFKPKASEENKKLEQEIEILTNQLSQFADINSSAVKSPQRKESAKPSKVTDDKILKAASKRRSLLVKELEENPEVFLKQAKLISRARDFSEDMQDQLEEHLELTGNLVVIHIDDFKNKKSKFEYFLEKPQILRRSNPKKQQLPKRFKLRFVKNPPQLLSDTKVTVSGVALDGNLVLETGEEKGGNYTLKSQVQGASTPLGDQKTLVLLVNFANDNSKPVTTEQISSLMFGNTNSVNEYYQINSYKKVSFSGDASNWLSIPSISSGCNYNQFADESKVAAKNAGFNLDLYSRIVYVLSKDGGCGNWAGLGTIGGAPSQAWIFCCQSDQRLFYHELGHNIGVGHASLMLCSSAPPTDYFSCYRDEYGDPTDTMGAWNSFYFNGPHKLAVGWIPSGNVLEVKTSGRYTVSDAETETSDIQLLKIPLYGTNHEYYLSYRQPFNYDAGLPANITRGLSIHFWPGLYPSANTGLIDSTYGSSGGAGDSSLIDGSTFLDNRNISIKQISHTLRSGLSPGKAEVDISVPNPPAGTITVSPNPCNIPPDQVNCPVTISWSTTNALNVSLQAVYGNYRTKLSTSSSGSIQQNVNIYGQVFELYSGALLIDTVTAYGKLDIPEPKITVGVDCIENGYIGDGVNISWSSPSGIAYVDISTSPDFSNFAYKYIGGLSSTKAPEGFVNAGNPLILNPNTIYYVRLYATGGPGPSTTFNLKNCSDPNSDLDKDGFKYSEEITIGTDPNKTCSVNSADNAWPPDLNNDGVVNFLDASSMVPYINKQKSFDKRFDLNLDSVIDPADIYQKIAPFLGQSCTNIQPSVALRDLPASLNGVAESFTNFDYDKDGFMDSIEVKVGTSVFRSCPDNISDSTWPPDVSNDGGVNGKDVSTLVPYINGSKPYNKRYDLNADGTIDQAGDVKIIQDNFLKECPK